jgi:two-component system, cell cycle sensor histidine kinase and response regulator CckA
LSGKRYSIIKNRSGDACSRRCQAEVATSISFAIPNASPISETPTGMGYAEFLLMKLPPDNLLYRDVQEIKHSAERAAALTRQLLAFSRKQVLQPRIIKLNDVVEHVQGMLRRLIGEDIELITALDAALGNVKADPGQIEQVIINLAINARDAMPRGGKLIIATANVKFPVHHYCQLETIPPERYAKLSVSDTGQGLDAESQAHVFEPFYTTKEMDKGTGLGLSTVYGIVKQSEGCINVVSQPGSGTTFTIYLPQVDESVSTPEAPPTDPASWLGDYFGRRRCGYGSPTNH